MSIQPQQQQHYPDGVDQTFYTYLCEQAAHLSHGWASHYMSKQDLFSRIVRRLAYEYLRENNLPMLHQADGMTIRTDGIPVEAMALLQYIAGRAIPEQEEKKV